MTDHKPKITVITPTYNRADLLPETIESVLNQDFTDFEYLILDDGSTDDTMEVVKPYLKDKRVKYLSHKNSGEADTVNWGWQLAKGKYFIQVNSDDLILPKLFLKSIEILDKHNFVATYTDFYFIDSSGKIIEEIKTAEWDFLTALRAFSCQCATPGTMLNKSKLRDISMLKRSSYKYISDVDMYWNIALKGNFCHISGFLAKWRKHDQGISNQRFKSIQECENWFKSYFSRRDLPDSVRTCKEETRKSMYSHFIRLALDSFFKDREYMLMKYAILLFISKKINIY